MRHSMLSRALDESTPEGLDCANELAQGAVRHGREDRKAGNGMGSGGQRRDNKL